MKNSQYLNIVFLKYEGIRVQMPKNQHVYYVLEIRQYPKTCNEFIVGFLYESSQSYKLTCKKFRN